MIIGKGSARKGFLWFGEVIVSATTAAIANIAVLEAKNYFFFVFTLAAAALWGYKLYKEYKGMEN